MAQTAIRTENSAAEKESTLMTKTYQRRKDRLGKHRARIVSRIDTIPLSKGFLPPNVRQISQLGLDPIIVVRFENIGTAVSGEQGEALLNALRKIAGQYLIVETDPRYFHPRSADFMIRLRA